MLWEMDDEGYEDQGRKGMELRKRSLSWLERFPKKLTFH